LQIAFEQFEGTERSIYEAARERVLIKTIFDVGANRGEVAKKLSFSFPEAVVHCFEPVSGTHQELLRAIQRCKQIRAYNVGLGNSEEVREIRLHSVDGTNSVVEELNEDIRPGERKEAVRITTIDGFCERNGIDIVDLIKTDTEGFDLNVLQGGERTITRGTKFIFSEFGLHEADHSHTSLSALWKYLEGLGFQLSGIYEPVYDKGGTFRYANALFARATRRP
jgi:FkbM family methyltransferase